MFLFSQSLIFVKSNNIFCSKNYIKNILLRQKKSFFELKVSDPYITFKDLDRTEYYNRHFPKNLKKLYPDSIHLSIFKTDLFFHIPPTKRMSLLMEIGRAHV